MNGKIQIVFYPHEFLFIPEGSYPGNRTPTNHLFLLGTEQPEAKWFDIISRLQNLMHGAMLRYLIYTVVASIPQRAAGAFLHSAPLGYDPF